MNLDTIRERLEGVRGSGSSFMARCPAHDDKEPSLSVRDAGDRILINCHAGCKPQDVLAAIGLTWTDVFAEGQGDRGFKLSLRVSERRQLAVRNGLEFAILEQYQAGNAKPSDAERIALAKRRLGALAQRYGMEEFEQITEEWRSGEAYKKAPIIAPTDEQLEAAARRKAVG